MGVSWGLGPPSALQILPSSKAVSATLLQEPGISDSGEGCRQRGVILSIQRALGESLSETSFVCLFFVNFLTGWRNHRSEFSFPSKCFNTSPNCNCGKDRDSLQFQQTLAHLIWEAVSFTAHCPSVNKHAALAG